MRGLQGLVGRSETTVVPGAANALTARLVEETGFEAVYVTGAGVANTFLGVPDIGLLTATELSTHVAAIRDAVAIPIIVDADTGFGNAVNVWRTVRTLESAGADAIQLEDQVFPKRCGHFGDTEVIESAVMVDKVAAACEARRSAACLVIARTDARTPLGLDEACRRANLYRGAGADVVFIEAPKSVEEVEIVAREVQGPKLLNLVEGGVTPRLPIERISELGFTFTLFANLALLAGMRAMRETLEYLHAGGDHGHAPAIGSWDDRQRLVRKPQFDAMSERYGDKGGRGRASIAISAP